MSRLEREEVQQFIFLVPAICIAPPFSQSCISRPMHGARNGLLLLPKVMGGK